MTKKVFFRTGLAGSVLGITKADLLFDAPITASKTIPDWYKNAQQFFGDEKKLRLIPDAPATLNVTYKRCVPFMEALTQGYVYTLADDIIVEKTNEGTIVSWRTYGKLITDHNEVQHPNLPVPKGYLDRVFKWENPYTIELPKGYSLWCTHPSNRFDLPFLTITGIVDADKYVRAIQFPFFLREDFEGIIEKGTPLAQLIPIKRDSWESKVLEADEDLEHRRLREFRGKLERSYKNQYWTKKFFK